MSAIAALGARADDSALDDLAMGLIEAGDGDCVKLKMSFWGWPSELFGFLF